MTDMQKELLYQLQQGLPITEHPFKELAKSVALSESEVLQFVESLFAEDKARRLGAVFDSRKLAYRSTLCGVVLSEDEVDKKLDLVLEHPGITHAYSRGWSPELSEDLKGAFTETSHPNFWFTFMAPADQFDNHFREITDHFAPAQVHDLPAQKRFKIDVIFDTREKETPTHQRRQPLTGKTESIELSNKEIEIVRALQGNIQLSTTPFRDIAQSVGIDQERLLSIMKQWKESGIIRRIPLILYHYKAGFKANGMCLWSVPEDQIDEFGIRIAQSPEVTHCYHRPKADGFAYNLYAMIHGNTWKQTYALFEKLQERAGVADGKMLCSLREYKKTSPIFFETK